MSHLEKYFRGVHQNANSFTVVPIISFESLLGF